MAGTIAMSADRRWSAAGWLFDWAVEFLAANVTDPQVKQQLREIVTENLGWLGLDDFGAEAEREMRELLRTKVVDVAEQTFDPAMSGRASAVDVLRRLADEA
jgi:hypothetical protein